jgi:Protein of unknown function (DUF4065)
MAGNRDFDSGRFKELVLYLAERSGEEVDPRMSRVKLNKLLYRSDFEAFRLLGVSITGATYIKGEHGPMAEQLPLAEEELGRAGYLHYRTDETGPFPRKVPIADESADEQQFSDDERKIIDRALEELAPHGGKGASKWSHEESVGWRLTKEDHVIPYETSIIASEPGPPSTVERLKRRVLSGIWD